MKVIIVTTWFPTAKKINSGIFVLKDALAVKAAGNDVRVVHLVAPQLDDGKRRFTESGIEVLRIPMNPGNPISIVRAANKLHRALAWADLVHTCAISALLPFAVKRPKQPWVHTEHFSGISNPESRTPAVKVAFPLISRLFRKPDVVTAVVKYLAEPIGAIRGRKKLTEVVPCIVPPLEEVPQLPDDTQAAGSADVPLRLVTVAALDPRKEPLLNIETIKELKTRGVVAEVTFVGGGSLKDQIQAKAHELGVADRVIFAGALPREGVLEQLAKAHMAFLPTRAENFLVAGAEAICSGRPLVAGATGGHGEYLDPSVSRLVNEQSAQDYADAIIDLQEEAKRFTAEEIAATIGDRFSPEKIGEGYNRVYRLAEQQR